MSSSTEPRDGREVGPPFPPVFALADPLVAMAAAAEEPRIVAAMVLGEVDGAVRDGCTPALPWLPVDAAPPPADLLVSMLSYAFGKLLKLLGVPLPPLRLSSVELRLLSTIAGLSSLRKSAGLTRLKS